MRGAAMRRGGSALAIAPMVAQARVPGLRHGEGEAQAAAAAGLLGLRGVARAAAVVVPVVIVVVAQAEEPHKPHDEGSDVEDSEANHEDPPLQGHRNWKGRRVTPSAARANVRPGDERSRAAAAA